MVISMNVMVLVRLCFRAGSYCPPPDLPPPLKRMRGNPPHHSPMTMPVVVHRVLRLSRKGMVIIMAIKILVVEDDEHILNVVKAFLQNEGYSVDVCSDGELARDMFYEESYDLVILDIMLPGVNGQELLKNFRVISGAPVLMITALTDETDQLTAFNNEADDYVTKPFSMQILVKRVEALLRRSGALQKEFNAGKLVLNTESYKVSYDNVEVLLTLREFEILLFLVQNKGKVVPHETLIAKVWGYDFNGDEGTVHTHIKNLRAKLPENIIKTVRGIGYQMAAT